MMTFEQRALMATMPTQGQGPEEGGMVRRELWQEIRRLRVREGLSVSELAFHTLCPQALCGRVL